MDLSGHMQVSCHLDLMASNRLRDSLTAIRKTTAVKFKVHDFNNYVIVINSILHNNGPPQQVIPPPRMQLLRIQLACESIPARQPTVITSSYSSYKS